MSSFSNVLSLLLKCLKLAFAHDRMGVEFELKHSALLAKKVHFSSPFIGTLRRFFVPTWFIAIVIYIVSPGECMSKHFQSCM